MPIRRPAIPIALALALLLTPGGVPAMAAPTAIAVSSQSEADALDAEAQALGEQGRWREAAGVRDRRLAWLRSHAEPRVVADEAYLAGRCHFRAGEPTEALACFQEALALEVSLGRGYQQIACWRNIGRVHFSQGAIDQAIPAFEHALALARQSGDDEEIGPALHNLGLCHVRRSAYRQALPLFEEAVAVGRRSKDASLGDTLSALGQTQRRLGRYREAEASLTEAIALLGPAEMFAEQASAFAALGAVFEMLGRYDEALTAYTQALAIRRRLGDAAGVASTQVDLAGLHTARGAYADALAGFDEAIAALRRAGGQGSLSNALTARGRAEVAVGRYDRALADFSEALALDRGRGDQEAIATQLGNLGELYLAWGQPEQAIAPCEEALAIHDALGLEAPAANALNRLGLALLKLGRPAEAFARFERALARVKGLGRDGDAGAVLLNMAVALDAMGEPARATALYTDALATARRVGRRMAEASCLNGLAARLARAGDHAGAIAHAEQALAIEQALGRTPEVATDLSNLGTYQCAAGRLQDARRNLEAAIAHYETLRLTARGDVRQAYLASQLGTYQQLVTCLIAQHAPDAAYLAAETARAKGLSETLAGTTQPVRPVAAAAARRALGPREAALVFGNTALTQMTAMALTHAQLRALALTPTDAPRTEAPGPRPAASGTRGLALEAAESEAAQSVLQRLVTAFRAALSRPTPAGRAEAIALGQRLYTLVIQPFEQEITGKDTLVVVPDGALATIPFEALVDAEGRYLGERLRVVYCHSLTVRAQLAGRRLPEGRKPLLAFGGAVYNPATSGPTPTLGQLRAANRATAGGASTKDTYASLGLGHWPDLPGTLAEVKAIAAGVPGATVVTGAAVNEASLKAMDLRRYRVLHFATHGLVVPEAPELSALVLSQGRQGPDDGYLCAREIAKLKLQADFVNLSACETGLGKLVGGEGVVGLSQAFFAAGANGLSMSLWSVADASTATFMAEVYRSVYHGRLGFSEAIARTKRRFIRGDFGEANRHPAVWAPFVYYGI